MPILPETLPLHMAKVEASDGTWLIVVSSVSETENGRNLLLRLTLELPVDEENFKSRELGMMVPAVLILDPETCAEVVDRIREWIDASEGDGFLDLLRQGS